AVPLRGTRCGSNYSRSRCAGHAAGRITRGPAARDTLRVELLAVPRTRCGLLLFDDGAGAVLEDGVALGDAALLGVAQDLGAPEREPDLAGGDALARRAGVDEVEVAGVGGERAPRLYRVEGDAALHGRVLRRVGELEVGHRDGEV